MAEVPPENLRSFESILRIVEILRSPQGCPWDKEQTHKSLAPFAIEEAYELVEAIESKDRECFIEELGDLLLQVIIHSEVAKNEKNFDIYDVLEKLCSKLVARHPHVFGDIKVSDPHSALYQWSKIKENENSNKKRSTSLGGPYELPSLQRAQKIGEKTKRDKFDWNHLNEVMLKVKEEMNELELALKSNLQDEIENELGDLFFTLAQLSRHLKFESEQVVRKANRRFEKRYQKMLELAKLDAPSEFRELSSEKKEKLWKVAKEIGESY